MLIAKQVLTAIAFIHDHNIVHRDIKAANVLIAKDGTIKLGDFGVCIRAAASSGDQKERLAGSPYWMAPEVIRREPLRDRKPQDIWSFGIFMFELLTGNPPLHQVDPARAMRTIAKSMPPRMESTVVGKDVCDFVNSCLHDDPDKVLFYCVLLCVINSLLNMHIRGHQQKIY